MYGFCARRGGGGGGGGGEVGRVRGAPSPPPPQPPPPSGPPAAAPYSAAPAATARALTGDPRLDETITSKTLEVRNRFQDKK